jgi:chromosome segregation protein
MASAIQADLRDARLRLLADDYVTQAAELQQEQADETAAAQLRASLEAAVAAARADEAALEAAELQDAPRVAAAQDTFVALAGLAERIRGAASLAAERHRYLSAPEPPRAGRDPDELDTEAAQLRGQEIELTGRLSTAGEQLTATVEDRRATEAALAEHERRLAAHAKAALQRADRLAGLRGQIEAAMSRAAAAEDETGRLAEAAGQATAQADQAQMEYAALQDQVTLETGRNDLAAAHERAAAELAGVTARVAELRRAEHTASENRAGCAARAQALVEAVSGGADASEVLLAEPGAFDGVLGPLAGLLTVADGAQEAIAAALGAAAGSVAVASLEAAVAIMTMLRAKDAGRAGLVIAADGAGLAVSDLARKAAESGGEPVTPAIDLVSGPDEIAGAIAELLGDVVVVPDLATGLRVLRAEPRLRVVTSDGDVLGTHWARGGSSGGQSLLSLRAAASQAEVQLSEAETRCQRAEEQLAAGLDDEKQASQAVAAAAAALQQADAVAAEMSGTLGSLAGRARAARDEVARLTDAIASAESARQDSLAQLAASRERLAELEAEQTSEPETGEETEASSTVRQRLAEDAVAARSAEMEARLEVRTVEERLRAIAGRADALAAAATAERQAAAWAVERAKRRAAGALVASAVLVGAKVALARVEESVAAADMERQEADAARGRRDGELKAIRVRIREASDELERVMDSAHGAQVARTTRQLQLDQIAARALEEFAVEAEVLTVDYAPGESFDRPATERRAHQAQRQLDQLGKVNPLALEEFAALEERHAFLVSQLEDLKKTRRDLLTVIREVDERVQEVFSRAYADTAREFAAIIERLFPGGEGRLLLTEPDDMLATGIDIEARPPGKRVKRLSLLSGGERALTAIAFLVAIFRARPSPFYVLDEVEAALDDTNLQRVLEVLAELRETSQLIVVTHQKRTMEVADTLYGVSMRGDGVSTVISQRLREREAV